MLTRVWARMRAIAASHDTDCFCTRSSLYSVELFLQKINSTHIYTACTVTLEQ